MKLITKFLIVVLAILIVPKVVPGVMVDGFMTALIVAILLGLINITLKPILFILTLPITLLTLGLFTFVLNALMFWLVASVVEGFEVEGFIPALLGSLLVAVISWVGDKLLDKD